MSPAINCRFVSSLRAEVFRGFKAELLALLPPDSKMHAYMKDNIFGPGRVEKWASYVHPGAHTLGIASTQRVESGNSALKQVLQRSGTMVKVNRAILGKVRDDANKTERLAAGCSVTAYISVQAPPREE